MANTVKKDNAESECWYNINYANLHATIHLSYQALQGNCEKLIEDSRSLAYKHTIKATNINEYVVVDDSVKVYGLVYEFEGNTATGTQFYLTDSVHHFLRGALYFNVTPNEDSLSPITVYINQDIRYFIETFSWK